MKICQFKLSIMDNNIFNITNFSLINNFIPFYHFISFLRNFVENNNEYLNNHFWLEIQYLEFDLIISPIYLVMNSFLINT